jgi:hypothetical protein
MHPTERGELEAFHDLYLAAPPGLGARVEHLGGAVCIALPETPRASSARSASNGALRSRRGPSRRELSAAETR